MKEPIVIHLITSLALVGGTAAKVRILIANSHYKHIVCFPKVDSNKKYIDEWNKLNNCILIEGITRKNYLKDAKIVMKVIKKYHATIIHAYFPPDTITASIVKLFSPTIKLVRSFEGNVQQNFIKRKIIKIALSKFDEAIFISKYVKNFYQNKIPSFLKGTVIYNSAARQGVINNSINHDIKKRMIVTVSGLNASKNLFVLIEAMKILKDRQIKAHLDVLGDGPLKGLLQQKIENFHIEEYVTLHGFSDMVIKYLDASSIYVHPADNEGFGIAVVEAMQRSCAIIVSDKGALPEIITDGFDGLIADAYNSENWANKIEYLLNDQSLVNKYGEAATHTAETKFSIATYVTKHEELYNHLLNY